MFVLGSCDFYCMLLFLYVLFNECCFVIFLSFITVLCERNSGSNYSKAAVWDKVLDIYNKVICLFWFVVLLFCFLLLGFKFLFICSVRVTTRTKSNCGRAGSAT